MSKWRNKISIKEYFTEETNNESVLHVCDMIIPQLRSILDKENKRINEKSKFALDESFAWDFEEVIQDFEFVKTGIESNSNPEEYSFDSWCEAFNEYMNKLYDLADSITKTGDSFATHEKFLWVG